MAGAPQGATREAGTPEPARSQDPKLAGSGASPAAPSTDNQIAAALEQRDLRYYGLAAWDNNDAGRLVEEIVAGVHDAEPATLRALLAVGLPFMDDMAKREVLAKLRRCPPA